MSPNALINVILLFTVAQWFPTAAAFPASGQEALQRTWPHVAHPLPVAEARGPERVNRESLGVVTDASSVAIRDLESGVELYAQEADVVRPIASISKLMTAIVLLEDYTWEGSDPATVLPGDVRDGGRWRYRFGDELTMDDLFSMMLIASGNNETMALVREVGATPEEFVARMNAKAQAMGLVHTHFEGPIGLSPENVSTAREVQKLLFAALSHEEIASRVQRQEVVTSSKGGNAYRVASTNELFHSYLNQAPYRVVGGKTGSLEEAGYCLTTRVERDGHVLDVTILGASEPDARFEDAEDLVSWVFDVFSWSS